jgi:hypothetical protein
MASGQSSESESQLLVPATDIADLKFIHRSARETTRRANTTERAGWRIRSNLVRIFSSQIIAAQLHLNPKIVAAPRAG